MIFCSISLEGWVDDQYAQMDSIRLCGPVRWVVIENLVQAIAAKGDWANGQTVDPVLKIRVFVHTEPKSLADQRNEICIPGIPVDKFERNPQGWKDGWNYVLWEQKI